jgi:hypothetical protein
MRPCVNNRHLNLTNCHLSDCLFINCRGGLVLSEAKKDCFAFCLGSLSFITIFFSLRQNKLERLSRKRIFSVEYDKL